MRIVIETVEPEAIRCRQLGDWRWNGDELIVYVNQEIPDAKSLILVGLHEMVEAILCKNYGITDEQVTAFDCQFEKERDAGMHALHAENGNDERACYHQQHLEASAIEMMMCSVLGTTWDVHTANLESTI